MTEIEIKINEKLDDFNFNKIIDKNWELIKIYDNIYQIETDNIKEQYLIKYFDDINYAKREYKFLSKYRKLSIPKVISGYFSKKFNYIIMSKEKGCDLNEYVRRNETFSEEEIKIIVKQLLYILSEMHKNKDIHQDIKPENIIYDSNSRKISLIDFEQKITKSYCSPEVLKNLKYNHKTDIWSCGISFYYLLVGKLPFNKKIDVFKDEPIYPEYLSENCIDFLKCLIEKDVDLRYDANDALDHEFLLE